MSENGRGFTGVLIITSELISSGYRDIRKILKTPCEKKYKVVGVTTVVVTLLVMIPIVIIFGTIRGIWNVTKEIAGKDLQIL